MKYHVSGANCKLTFWYHMYGKAMGTLKVMIKTEQDGHITPWQKSGNQGNAWHQATVKIRSRRNFGVMFVALMGTSYTADVAIDDVKFENCAVGTKAATCPADQFLCYDGTMCIQRRYLCDHHHDCDDNSDENAQMCGELYMFVYIHIILGMKICTIYTILCILKRTFEFIIYFIIIIISHMV